jgi:hypothetical protein
MMTKATQAPVDTTPWEPTVIGMWNYFREHYCPPDVDEQEEQVNLCVFVSAINMFVAHICYLAGSVKSREEFYVMFDAFRREARHLATQFNHERAM